MRDDAAPEKCVFPRSLRPVEELIDDDNVARLVLLLQRADGADADDPSHAEFFHRVDIRAVIQLGRQNPMAASMPGKEDNAASAQFAGKEAIGRRAEGCLELDPFLFRKPFDTIKAAAADDANLMHGQKLKRTN